MHFFNFCVGVRRRGWPFTTFAIEAHFVLFKLKDSLLLRIMEPSFPFLQLVPGLPHALRLLLHRVRGVCGL